MTDIFTATNGIKIRSRGFPDIIEMTPGSEKEHWDPLGGYVEGTLMDAAMAEWYQHRRDQELGRWRDPENPDHLVYQSEPYVQGYRRIAVVNERDMTGVHTFSEGAEEGSTDPKALTAQRYFAAHPEPKPWHSAEAGTFWRIHLDADDGFGRLTIAHGDNTFTDQYGIGWKAHDIHRADRLYPEESRDE